MFPFDKVIVISWVIFWLYWLGSAFGSKRNARSNLRQFAGIRVVIFIMAVILFRLLNTKNYTFQNRVLTHSEPVQTLGLIIFFLGLILAIWARLNLGKNWGMPMTEKQDPELVTSGPYDYIRHPIYTGVLLAMLGSALAISLYWLAIFVISGTYFIYSAVMEERLMTKQFPKVYPAYKHRSKMLIPFIF